MTQARPSAPPAVRWIARKLEESGFETWTVGGAVRDVLLGVPSGDWDLATRARPDDVRRVFGRTIPIGVEHGTVGVLADDGTMYEVTTFRRDVETDGRHAVVAFADRIEDDLSRRDFTLNAIAWHPLQQRLFDPFGGTRDLEARVLRCVGEPGERFAEDWLRILRALRFAGRFGLAIHEATWAAMSASVSHLTDLSAERIREELIKVLDADPRPSTALGLYRSSGALAVLYPELEAFAAADAEGWARTLRSVDALPVRRPFLRFAALVRPIEPRHAAPLLVRLRLSNAQVDETALRAAAAPLPPAGADDAALRGWLSRTGPERLSAIARLDLAMARATHVPLAPTPADVVASWRRLRQVRATRPPLAVGDLALDGRDLIRLGMRPGPHFGRILEALLAWVLEEPERNRTEALEVRALHEAAALPGESEGKSGV